MHNTGYGVTTAVATGSALLGHDPCGSDASSNLKSRHYKIMTHLCSVTVATGSDRNFLWKRGREEPHHDLVAKLVQG